MQRRHGDEMDMPMPSHSSTASSSMHSSMTMQMVFFADTNTPIYSHAFAPNSTGQYAGICIFLIILGFIFRCLLAIRCNFLPLLAWATHRRDTDILRNDPDEKKAAIAMHHPERRPWRINEALLRACLDTIIAGVSYLLMLAVMTMNVGYFLSILGGTFLGSFVVGGFTGATAH